MLILLCECGVGVIAAITTFVLAQGFLLDRVSSSAGLLKKRWSNTRLPQVALGFWKASNGFHFASFYIKESFYSCKFTLWFG